MAIQIKLTRGRLVFRENIDRNGPALTLAFGDRATFRTAFNSLQNDGDEVITQGRFARIEDFTSRPVAICKTEAQADAIVTALGAGFTKRPQGAAVDGFAFVVTQD